jgi:hypothetical protein
MRLWYLGDAWCTEDAGSFFFVERIQCKGPGVVRRFLFVSRLILLLFHLVQPVRIS